SGAIAAHVYATVGTFNATLTVTDNSSLTGSTYKHITVQAPPPPQPPVARFVAAPSPVNPGVAVQFNGFTSSDPDGSIVSYTWDFGDSNASTGVVVTHAYAASGLYAVRLTVVDNQSLSGNVTHTINVNFPPEASFEISPLIRYIGTMVTFDGSPSSDRDGSIASYTWDFGDGITGSGVQTQHAYTAKGIVVVRLTVVDNLGLSGETSSAFPIRDRPPQILSSVPGPGGVTVNVSATRSFTVTASDPDGDPIGYLWVVNGLMQSSYTNSFNFTAASVGTYTVNVTVTDNTLSVWREWTVTVVASESPPHPIAVDLLPLALIAAAVIGAVVLVVLARRRRWSKRVPPPPPPR
ncbi:MAG TPA: PKD domain-containing protein, partial [Thermoplasmata archaeon]|nr:PKD domain-containing protein [Thermoplasmata archaeon]